VVQTKQGNQQAGKKVSGAQEAEGSVASGWQKVQKKMPWGGPTKKYGGFTQKKAWKQTEKTIKGQGN